MRKREWPYGHYDEGVSPTPKSRLRTEIQCWKKTIHIIRHLLTVANIQFGVVDGSMSISERKKELSRFEDDSAVSVLLMTLGTGSVG
jgi:hypothetical protein